MRIHFRNVIGSAIERGVIVGFHRAMTPIKKKGSGRSKTTKSVPRTHEESVQVILDCIWESLDTIVDFDDEGQGANDEEESSGNQIGFSTDLVSNIGVESDEDFEDDAEDIFRTHLTQKE